MTATRLYRIGRRGLMIGLAVVTTVGCSSLRRPAPVVDRSADPGILSEIEERLAAEPSLATAPIRVTVDGGVAVLHGSVQGMGQWGCAIRNAELTTGVSTVVDNLVIDRGPTSVACRAPRDWPPTRAGPQHAPGAEG